MKPQPHPGPRPASRPKRPYFSSGPTAKRPGWGVAVLENATVGRWHRASPAKDKLRHCIQQMRAILGVPEGYRLGIVPASDTGAVEMALWSLLGARGVDVFAWDIFGATWLADIAQHLPLTDIRVFTAEYGHIPDLSQYDNARDCVLTWNATAAGVIVPHADWISPKREGLVIADSTSAVFAVEMPFEKLDVVTFSWQKALGGEGGHGVIILSPRACHRLESYTPPWPIPKIFRLASEGRLNEGIFIGETINTPSMLCVEDALDALAWAARIGGRKALIERVNRNHAVVRDWLEGHPNFAFMAEDRATISPVSMTICLKSDKFLAQAEPQQRKIIQAIVDLLAAEGIAFDIGGHRAAPPSLRLWGGPTVETTDLTALLPWIDWALAEVMADERSK